MTAVAKLSGWCSEWNTAMAKLSGWQRDEVIDKMLLGEVFGSHAACCRMKNQDAYISLRIIINNAMAGQEIDKVPFTFLNRSGETVECLLSVTRKVDEEDMVTGLFCVLHIASNELQHVLQVQQLSDQSVMKRLKVLSYIRHETRNPISGNMFCRKMLEGTELSDEQKELLNTGEKCHLQLNNILDDWDLENITDSWLHLEMVEFFLHDVVVTAVSQVMIASQAKGVQIVYDSSNGFMNEGVFGDSLRLQQILADFLHVSVKFSPSGGQVEIIVSLLKDRLGDSLHVVRLELRITHTGSGVPENLLSDMFGRNDSPSEEGLSLLVCRKLLHLMNGTVRYLRGAGKSAFIISVELASAPKAASTRT